MSNLVSLANGRVTTSSLIVAQHFHKLHKDVLRSINNLECSEDFTQRNFAPSEYKDNSGKSNRCYIITKDGFMFLVMGFTGKEAALWKERFINAFNEMEAKLQEKSTPHTLAPAQQQAIQSAVAARCGRDSRSYQSVYTALKARFQVARYDQIPAVQFDEAIRYIETVNIPSSAPALPTVNLLDKDYFAKVRDIANKFADDWSRVHKGEDVHPTLTIPDDVLAGIVAQQLSRQNFRLYIDYAGSLSVEAITQKSPYEGLAKAISDPGNIGLTDEVIEEIGAACVKALAYRAQQRKSIFSRTRGAK